MKKSSASGTSPLSQFPCDGDCKSCPEALRVIEWDEEEGEEHRCPGTLFSNRKNFFVSLKDEIGK